MTLTALDENDPRLREVCAPLSRTDLRRKAQQAEIDELLDYVYGKSNKAVPGSVQDRRRPAIVGLSASQVGVMKQICIADLSIGRRGYTDLQVLVNPRIVWRSKTMMEKPEGCVNFPTIWGMARRPKSVRVEAWDRSGHDVLLRLEGWSAAVMQHEVDHLNGRLFIDRLTDPAQADLVLPREFAVYRKTKGEWTKKIDVSDRVVGD